LAQMFASAHPRHTLRGRILNLDDPTPLAIARALPKKKQEKGGAKRAAMEAKFAGR
jgi:hypothetical protein